MEPRFNDDWFSKNIPVWEELFKEMRGKQDLRFLEIGTWEGRSACWLLQHVLTHPSSSLTCIDPFGKPSMERKKFERFAKAEELFRSNIKAVGAESRVTFIRARSHDVLPTLPPEHYDCIYIDGGHAAPIVLTNAVWCWRILKNGGLLIFDDYKWKQKNDPLLEPAMAIDAFLSIFQRQYVLLYQGWQIVVRKEAKDK